MGKKIITLACGFIFKLVFAQAEIGTANPTRTLDVNGTARLSNLVDIEGINQSASFNRKILSDANGVLGNASNISKTTFGLNDVSQAIMSNNVSTVQADGNISLNLSTTVTVPANTDALIMVDYNIPAYKINGNGNCNYVGVTLMKSTNSSADQELDQGSRKITFPSYSANAAAQGFPIIGKAIDHITNNSASPIKVVYKPMGYVETNTGTIYFGMWSGTGHNYNWGRGSMITTSYFKAL